MNRSHTTSPDSSHQAGPERLSTEQLKNVSAGGELPPGYSFIDVEKFDPKYGDCVQRQVLCPDGSRLWHWDYYEMIGRAWRHYRTH